MSFTGKLRAFTGIGAVATGMVATNNYFENKDKEAAAKIEDAKHQKAELQRRAADQVRQAAEQEKRRNSVNNPILSVDRFDLAPTDDPLVFPPLVTIPAPTRGTISGTEARDPIVTDNRQTQVIDPKEGLNEIAVLKVDFGKKIIRRSLSGNQDNNLILGIQPLLQHDRADITHDSQTGNITVAFGQEGKTDFGPRPRPGHQPQLLVVEGQTEPNSVAGVATKPSPTVSRKPTVAKLSVEKKNGEIELVWDKPLLTEDDWSQAIQSAKTAAVNLNREADPTAQNLGSVAYIDISSMYKAFLEGLKGLGSPTGGTGSGGASGRKLTPEEEKRAAYIAEKVIILKGAIEANKALLERAGDLSASRLGAPSSTTGTISRF